MGTTAGRVKAGEGLTSSMPQQSDVKDVVPSLCRDVARATLRKPLAGGKPLVDTIGEDLAEVLAQELAAKLLKVMPAAVVATIGGDLLEGAEAIAEFVYGDTAERRKVYHLVQHGRFPTFRLGNTVCARKSVVLAWIRQQEEDAIRVR